MSRVGVSVRLSAVALLAACAPPPPTTVTATSPTTTARREAADPTAGVDAAMWRATSTTQRASRARPTPTTSPRAATSGRRAYGVRLVSSTAYCLTGRMASGRRVYVGAVAMNGEPFGARWEVLSGPLRGRVLIVEDRIGHSSQFDVAMPGDCPAAVRYGRRTIEIRRVN